MSNSPEGEIKINLDPMKSLDAVMQDLRKERIVILFSGGADSALMYHLALKMKYDPMLLFIDYGQKFATDEFEAAQEIAGTKPITHLDMSIISGAISSKLTDAEGEMNKPYEGSSEFYVPYRNTVLVSIACAMAETMEAKQVWIGCDYSDRINLFPDCYQEWVVQFNNYLDAYAVPEYRKVRLVAPLLGMSKDMVLRMLKSFGISGFFSGYGDIG